jgi:oligopeptide/dipeptide ABC transporter ATP-binding protein
MGIAHHGAAVQELTTAAPPVLAMRDVWVSVASRRGRAAILRGVDLDVRRGELLGIVGETGSGKSTAALTMIGLLPPTLQVTGGAIELDGQDVTDAPERILRTIRGGRVAMIFQDPKSHLNPVFPIGEQLVDVIRVHGVGSAAAARVRAIELLARVNLPDPERLLATYPHQLSGGMAQRVMIAMALAGDPEVLIADEPTSALDVTVQAQILALLRQLARDRGLAVVLISHNLAAVAQVCDRVAIMYAGKVVETCSIRALLDRPGHPYTRGLLAAVPRVGADIADVRGIPGRIANIFAQPQGCCAFADRCPSAMAACRATDPPPVAIAADHIVACLLAGEARGVE